MSLENLCQLLPVEIRIIILEFMNVDDRPYARFKDDAGRNIYRLFNTVMKVDISKLICSHNVRTFSHISWTHGGRMFLFETEHAIFGAKLVELTMYDSDKKFETGPIEISATFRRWAQWLVSRVEEVRIHVSMLSLYRPQAGDHVLKTMNSIYEALDTGNKCKLSIDVWLIAYSVSESEKTAEIVPKLLMDSRVRKVEMHSITTDGRMAKLLPIPQDVVGTMVNHLHAAKQVPFLDKLYIDLTAHMKVACSIDQWFWHTYGRCISGIQVTHIDEVEKDEIEGVDVFYSSILPYLGPKLHKLIISMASCKLFGLENFATHAPRELQIRPNQSCNVCDLVLLILFAVRAERLHRMWIRSCYIVAPSLELLRDSVRLLDSVRGKHALTFRLMDCKFVIPDDNGEANTVHSFSNDFLDTDDVVDLVSKYQT